ncbi:MULTISPECIES: hypothetical protein [unclassified Clostridium]|uniref:hypothetical protein n=1 Tax=unclassified Clostridium TaxID=2614128 RepID=UPI002914C58E|nr:hypothetical protein [Clostridium sp.]MDU5107689.1 hypothetical protein [Clostridium sp.]
MIRYLALLSIISTTIFSSNFSNIKADDVKSKGNALRVFSEYRINLSKEDKFDDFWTPKNEGYLNETQKAKINSLREKVNKGENLTITECSELKMIKADVIKLKLGEDKFKELEKLINKREGNLELTLPERKRLYELNKESRE